MRQPDEIRNAFSSREALDGRRRFFLVGIGGAGMSALARMLKVRGFEVEGSDQSESVEVLRLREEGITVHAGHREQPVTDWAAVDPTHSAVILTDAIDLKISPEVAVTRALELPMVRRSQALGWLLQPYRVIAVTGTHGKTTTTGLVGSALIGAGLDPLVVVGASIPQWNGPIREGKGQWAVVEACEAYDAFHDLDPTLVVLTNLELDHVDFHGNYENLRASVLRFVNRIPADGALIYCSEDAGAKEISALADVNGIGYASGAPELQGLALPGHHNVLNASGALAALQFVGQTEAVDTEAAIRDLAAFAGAERRLQVLHDGDVVVVDDYAHHPTEIVASLSALRQRYFAAGREGRLVVVYQPHLYSRTAPLIKEFAEALSLADHVFLTDIYPAREAPMPGVSSGRIAEHLTKPASYVPSRHLLPLQVRKFIRPGDVVVGMGAGTISDFAPQLIQEIQSRPLTGEKPLKIAVLYGGDSSEREVSLHSGRQVFEALKSLGHDAFLIDLTDRVLGAGDLSAFLGPNRPDLAFLAVHGTHAEDGAIQGLLEILQVPYTGSGILASANCMDKEATKRVLRANGIRVPNGVVATSVDDVIEIRPPVVVKPNAQGSTVGLRFVEEGGDLGGALAYALQFDRAVIVEEWVRGMEISVPILDDLALPPVEIAPASGKYDFESKYTPGATIEIAPARLPESVLHETQRISLACHRLLGCSGATRTDMIVRQDPQNPEQVEIFVLEVNTLPGMTRTSLLPNSAQAAGITFESLCQRLVDDAMRRNGERQ